MRKNKLLRHGETILRVLELSLIHIYCEYPLDSDQVSPLRGEKQ